MMMAPVERNGGLHIGRPAKLFDLPAGVTLGFFSIAPDGKRFLAMQTGAEATQTITVAQNWAKAFEGRK
jgi:hypothetical protein